MKISYLLSKSAKNIKALNAKEKREYLLKKQREQAIKKREENNNKRIKEFAENISKLKKTDIVHLDNNGIELLGEKTLEDFEFNRKIRICNFYQNYLFNRSVAKFKQSFFKQKYIFHSPVNFLGNKDKNDRKNKSDEKENEDNFGALSSLSKKRILNALKTH